MQGALGKLAQGMERLLAAGSIEIGGDPAGRKQFGQSHACARHC